MVIPPSQKRDADDDQTGSPAKRGKLMEAMRRHVTAPGAMRVLLTNILTVWMLRGTTLVCRFLLTIFAVRLLPLDDFGTYGLITAAVATGVYILGLQFFTFNLREIASTDDPVRQACHIRDQLAFHAVGYLCFFLLFPVLLFGGRMEINPWLLILLPAEHLSQEGYRLLVALSRVRAANAIFFIRSGAWVLLWIAYGWWVKVPSLESLCAFWLSGTSVSIAITVIASRGMQWKQVMKRPVDWAWIRRGLRTCALYSGIVVFFAVAQYTNRYVLDHSHGAAAVGIFFFFVSMASPVYTLVEVGPYSVLQPQLLRLYPGQPGEYRNKLRVLAVGVGLSGLLATVVVVGITLVYIHVGARSDLMANLPAFGWVCVGSLLSCFVLVPQAHLFTLKSDRSILITNFISMLTALSSSLWLIPRFGVIGAAWSGALTSAVLLLLSTGLALRRGVLPA